jgi:hypothetical protein
MEVAMRMPVFLVLLAATCLSAGCAGTPPAADPRPARVASEYDPDPLYVAQVEAAARRRNVDVVWVNPRRVKDRRD